MTKQIVGVSIPIDSFSQFVKYCPRSSVSGNILQTSGEKFLNDAHYFCDLS